MAAAAYLLDTNVVLYLLRGKAAGEAIDATFGFRSGRTTAIVSVVTVGELRAIAALSGWGDKKQSTLRELLGQIVQLSISRDDILDAYARVEYYTRKQLSPAKPMAKNDLWIAATALAARLPILTADNDFEGVKGMGIEVVVLDANTGSPRRA